MEKKTNKIDNSESTTEKIEKKKLNIRNTEDTDKTNKNEKESNLSDSKKNIKKKSSKGLMNFVIQMKNPESGLELKTRKGIDKNGDEVLYHSCFVGAEAVDWMMNMLNIKKRTDGMKLLQKLLDQGVFKHVEGGNLLEDSSESFYTFQKIIE